MVWCLTILFVSADRRHNECVGQDQTQNVCVGIEPYARACQQQLIECAFTGPGPPSRPRAMASLKAQRLLPIASSKSIISIESIKSVKSIKSCMIRMAPNFHTARAVSSYSYSRGRNFHISVPTWYHTGTVHTSYCFPRNIDTVVRCLPVTAEFLCVIRPSPRSMRPS